MSKLLFDEQPLIVSKGLAKLIGLNEAIVLQQIHYWLEINKKVKVNLHDGKYWTYNSIKKWHQENFDFWSYDTVKRTFAILENKKLLISNNYNIKKYDQTKWYTINYNMLEALNLPISAKCTNATEQIAPMDYGKMHQPIPETSKEISKENLSVLQSSKEDRKGKMEKPIKKEPSPIQKTATNSNQSEDPQHNLDYITIEKIVQEQVNYASLIKDKPHWLKEINELIEIMVNIYMLNNPKVNIDGEQQTTEYIKGAIKKIGYNNILYTIEQFNSIDEPISKKKAYKTSILFNSLTEMESHYTNQFNIGAL